MVAARDAFSNPANRCRAKETAISNTHTYKVITVGANSGVHCEDTGVGISARHEYLDIDAGEASHVHPGNIDIQDTK
jgi:hypothetical protein